MRGIHALALAAAAAVRAAYACPPLRGPSGFAPAFAEASGAVPARASTEPCPRDLDLRVGSARQQLILGRLPAILARILGRALPGAV